ARRRRRGAGRARTGLLAGRDDHGLAGLPASAHGLAEHQPAGLGVDMDGVAAAELAGQDLLRQRVLELGLDRALERARAVHRVEADVAEQVEGPVAELDR